MSLHKTLTPFDIHAPYSYVYADTAARLADTGYIPGIQITFIAADVGKFARQLDDNSVWMLTSTTPTWKQVFGDQPYIILGANRGATATNIYLRAHNDLPTNISPIVLPFDTTLISMSLSTASAQTWIAQIRLGGSPVAGASLPAVAVAKAWRDDLAINFSAGDAVQLYCNGSSIDRPNVYAVFRRR
jgi:hypothetical protein